MPVNIIFPFPPIPTLGFIRLLKLLLPLICADPNKIFPDSTEKDEEVLIKAPFVPSVPVPEPLSCKLLLIEWPFKSK